MKKIAATRKDFGQKLVAVDPKEQVALDRWSKRLQAIEPGEIVYIGAMEPPSPALTAWHILLCKAIFEGQERFTDFKAFRGFLYIMAGHCQEFKVRGKKIRLPQSWSWDDLPNDYDRSEFHESVVAALYNEDVQLAIWPHLKKHDRTEMMMTLISRAEHEREMHKRQKAFRAQQKRQQQQALTKGIVIDGELVEQPKENVLAA